MDSARTEWQALDVRVMQLLPAGLVDPKASDASLSPLQRQLLARHAEAREAVERLKACPASELDAALQKTELATRTLFHAIWFVEHRERHGALDVTGVHQTRPGALVARSLAARNLS